MNNLIGKVLGNRYTLLDKIGEGGMALVYKARCQLLNRYVAVKILRPEFTSDEEFIKKFRRESMAAASLSHSNIVGIYDFGEEDGIYYIVMEYVKGTTLKQYIKECGKVDYRETLRIISQIAYALEHAHKNGVVHRDIKPHNILITEEKAVKVTDFGIARASSSTTMINTGTVMGSAHYFSPEQARGGFTDNRTDIYSLGVVMYEMLTGKPPYDADSPITIALKHIQDKLVAPQSLDADIPIAVNDIVVKAMEKDMNNRYQSAAEMIVDINEAEINPDKTIRPKGIIDKEATMVIPAIKEDILNDDEPEKEEVKHSGKKVRNIIIIAVIAAVLIGIGGFAAFNIFFVVKDVTVPSIKGMKQEEAKAQLTKLKLVFEVADSESDSSDVGTVIKTYPDIGTTVKENSIVKVILSSGPKKVTVPDLKKLDISTAETMLKGLNLVLGSTPDRKFSSTIPKDLIIEQNPTKDTSVFEGTTVDVTVSDGPELKIVTVPHVIGKSLSEATKILKGANLKVGTPLSGSDTNYVNDVVIGLDIAEGTQVKQGTSIVLTINKLDTNTDTAPDNQTQTPDQSGSGSNTTQNN